MNDTNTDMSMQERTKNMWNAEPHAAPEANPLFVMEGSLASGEALQLILSDITRGALPPGTKLKVRELNERYGITATPLREALAQLAARGLVQVEDRRGFRVPPVSLEQLHDLSRSRQIVESEALRLAIKHGDHAWEGELLSGFHQLKREIECRDPASDEWLDAYERQHHKFHKILIAACPLQSIKDFCDNLYIQMTRYRRLLKGLGFSGEIGKGEHGPLVDATLARNEEEALFLLRRHLNLPVAAIERYLQEQ